MPDSHARFEPTRWSLVLAVRGREPERARAALEELCAAYWYPLYAFARRKGLSSADASDAVQGLFASVLERGDLAGLERERGRFRSWWMAALLHHLADERDRQGAHKRGGGTAPLSLDRERADSRWQLEPRSTETPEQAFERSFALELLERALERLKREYRERGQGDLAAVLLPHLAGAGEEAQAEAGARVGLNANAFKVALHRLRARYREALRAEVADIVREPAEIDGELSALLTALRRPG